MVPEETMQDLHARVVEIQDRLSVQKMTDHDILIRLSTQSEGIATQLNNLATNQARDAANMDTRVRALEQARWMIVGAAAAVGALAGYLSQFLKHS